MSESVPKDEQETVITRCRVEKRYRISTTDTTEVTRLRRAGYDPAEDPAAEPYLVYEIPFEAIPPYRSAKTIYALRARAQRIKKRSTVVESPRSTLTVPRSNVQILSSKIVVAASGSWNVIRSAS